jgi:hypothetical protein
MPCPPAVLLLIWELLTQEPIPSLTYVEFPLRIWESIASPIKLTNLSLRRLSL